MTLKTVLKKLRFTVLFFVPIVSFAAPIKVAVIDTGVKPLKGSLEEGWNFLTKSTDVKDTSGHGTKMAKEILKHCAGCKIIPLKVSKNGSGIRPNDVAKAIRMALEKKARVINVSFGMTAGTADLRKSIEEAAEQGAIVVSAAGRGVPNPFKPRSLEKLFPQAFADVIVVGVAESESKPDDFTNFGSPMDLVVVAGDVDKNSSKSAAIVSGYVAKILKRRPGYSVRPIRQLLRLSTKRPLHPNPEKLGYGVFEPERLPTTYLKELDYRVYHVNEEFALIDFNSMRDINYLQPLWICAEKDAIFKEPERIRNRLKRGRARINLNLTPSKKCELKVKITYQDGTKKNYKIALKTEK